MNFTLRRNERTTTHSDKLLAYFEGSSGRPSSSCAHGLHFDDAGAIGCYGKLRLRSVFQPLFAAATMRPAAYEALLRVRDETGGTISPPEAFKLPKTAEEIVYFDRLCRTIHAVNFVNQAEAGEFLFLNVDGRHLLSVDGGTHGSAFETLLSYCGLKPSQVVLEVLESRIDNVGMLAAAVTAYQRRGYRVAIDDFGCRHSNFDRLWQLSPDIVKLDRGLIVQSTTNPRAKLILPKLVEIIHDLGAQVVCEGIETAEQHVLAVEAGVDLLQGFYYARPAPQLQRAVTLEKGLQPISNRMP